MKQVKDNEIVDMVKNNENYEIKTKSQDILIAYELEKSKASKVNDSKKKKIFIGTFSGLALVGACSLALYFAFGKSESLIPSNNNSNNTEIFIPTSNEHLKKQLVTFASFNNSNNSSSILKRKSLNKSLSLADEDKSLFEETVDVFEKVEKGVQDVFDYENITIESVSITFSYNNVEYKCANKFLKNNELLATFYFNERVIDDDEVEFSGLYVVENMYYNAVFVEENEVSKNETEKEVVACFEAIDKTIDPYYYVVEKEEEYEEHESENSYSYSVYNSKSDYLRENFITKVEYEFENQIMEISYEESTKQYEFSNISLSNYSENSYTFNASYEDETNDIEKEFGKVRVVISSNSRTYTLIDENYTITRP